MKNNFSSYAFWVAVTGAIVVFLQNLGKVVGFNFNSSAFESIVLSFCGILVVLGVLNQNKDENSDLKEDEPNLKDSSNENEELSKEIKAENEENIAKTNNENIENNENDIKNETKDEINKIDHKNEKD